MDLAQTYDRIARDWHRDHQSDDWWVEGTDKFISFLPNGASVLDVGCGSGVKSKYFVDRGFTVTGIDISEKLLEIARGLAPVAKLRKLSMLELDKLPNTYDGVFAQASLLHIPREKASVVVGQMAERATQGGYVYTAVKEAKENKPLEAVLKENDYGYEYERFFSYYTLLDLENYFSDADLKVIWKDRKEMGSTTWLQIIGRK